MKATALAPREEQRPLSAAEKQEFARLKEVVRKGMQVFMEVGLALQEIHDLDLYRDDYSTFEAFVDAEHGWARRHAYRLMDAARVAKALCPIGHIPQPSHETQVRPLTVLKEPEQWRAAWKAAVQEAGGRQPTEKIVKQVVDRMKETPKMDSPDKEDAPEVAKQDNIPKCQRPREYRNAFGPDAPPEEREITIGTAPTTAARQIAGHFWRETARDFQQSLLEEYDDEQLRDVQQMAREILNRRARLARFQKGTTS